MNSRFVFLHGLGLSNAIWRPLLPFVSGFSLTPNLPGHGGSKGNFDFGSMWKYVSGLQSRKNWEDSVLVLHSMSSAMLPEILESKIRPRSLVLLEANLLDEGEGWSRRISRMADDEYDRYVKCLKKFHATILRSQLRSDQEQKFLMEWSAGFSQFDTVAFREIAANLCVRTESGEIVSALKKLDMPIKCIQGKWTEFKGISLLDHLGIPIITIDNSAHYPMIDNPLETWDAIISNIKGM